MNSEPDLADASPAAPVFQLNYGALDFGWLELDWRIGGFRAPTRVSTSFSDPIGDWVKACRLFCDAAENLERSPPPWGREEYFEFALHEEPAAHTLRLSDVPPWPTVALARIRLKVEFRVEGLSRDDAAKPPDRVWPEVEFSLLQVATEVCRASRAALRRHGFRHLSTASLRDREFPAGELLELHRYVYPAEVLVKFPDEYALLRAEEIA